MDEGTERFPQPEGKGAAVAVTVDVDAESVMLAAGRDLEHRASPASHRRYGPLAGMPRLLRILQRPAVWAATLGEFSGRVAM